MFEDFNAKAEYEQHVNPHVKAALDAAREHKIPCVFTAGVASSAELYTLATSLVGIGSDRCGTRLHIVATVVHENVEIEPSGSEDGSVVLNLRNRKAQVPVFDVTFVGEAKKDIPVAAPEVGLCFDHSAEFEAEVLPLLRRLYAACEKHGIPLTVGCSYSRDADGPGEFSAAVHINSERCSDRIAAASVILDPERQVTLTKEGIRVEPA